MKLLKKLLLITLGIMFCLFLFELKPTSVYASESQDIIVRASCDEYGNVELELYYDPA